VENGGRITGRHFFFFFFFFFLTLTVRLV